MALVAAACATSTGLHDDLRAIGAFCREHGVWFHVDAAHGGSALLSPSARGPARGIEHADSVIWDAHKMMRTSAASARPCSCAEGDLEAAFQQNAAYLFYEDADVLGRACSSGRWSARRRRSACELFMNLAFRGEAGSAATWPTSTTRRFASGS